MQHRGFLLLHNIGKRRNIAGLLQCAEAFGLEKAFIIGRKQNFFDDLENQDDSVEGQKKKRRLLKEITAEYSKNNEIALEGEKGIELEFLEGIEQAKQYFKERNIAICGVEIGGSSKNIINHRFQGDTVFLMGNEGQGLVEAHRKICDFFVYVPQYTTKTASLNVSCAAAIVFHHFAQQNCKQGENNNASH